MQLPLIASLSEYFRFYFTYSRWKIILFMVLTILGSAMDVVGISMLVPLVDKVGMTKDVPWYCQVIYDIFTWAGIPATLLSMSLVILVIIWIKGLIILFQRTLQARIMADLIIKMREIAVKDFCGISYEFYSKKNTGYFNNIVTVESPRASEAFLQYSTALACVANIFVYMFGLLIFNWLVLLAAIVFGVIFLLAFRFIYRFSRRFSLDLSRGNAVLQNLMIQTIAGFKYLKSTNRTEILRKQVDREIVDLGEANFKIAALTGFIEAISEPVAVSGAICYVLITWFSGAPIIGAAPVLFLLYRAFRQVSGFQNMWQKFIAKTGSIEIFMEAGRNFSKHREEPGKQHVAELNDKIILDNVVMRYGERQVLNGISLEIPKNRTVAIVGESGSGKTTVANLLTGIINPVSGCVKLDSEDYRKLNLPELRSKIGYVSQENVMFHDTIVFNIAMEYLNENDSKAWERMTEAMKMANADKFVNDTEKGLMTLLGDRGITLSGGQRQRLQIARELYRQPEILILDEATSNLDSESEALIQTSIDNLKGKLTTVIIAHRLSTIRNADWIYVFSGGQVAEQGVYNDLANKPESLFARMLKFQKLEEDKKSN